MADLELLPGCIHVGMTRDGNLVHVWPTPDPRRWHLSFSRGSQATYEPVLATEVPGVLDRWGVSVEAWLRWVGPLPEQSPEPA